MGLVPEINYLAILQTNYNMTFDNSSELHYSFLCIGYCRDSNLLEAMTVLILHILLTQS